MRCVNGIYVSKQQWFCDGNEKWQLLMKPNDGYVW